MSGKMIIDMDSLTFDEMDELEVLSGSTFDSLTDKGTPKAKLMKALVFITLKRSDPNITFEEVGKMTLQAMDFTGDATGTLVNPT